MIKIAWHFGEPPENMTVRQVYAIVFDQTGRTLLKNRTNRQQTSIRNDWWNS